MLCSMLCMVLSAAVCDLYLVVRTMPVGMRENSPVRQTDTHTQTHVHTSSHTCVGPSGR